MQWFGRGWGASICEPESHVPTPAGMPCGRCEEAIEAGDFGVMMPFCMQDGNSLRPLHYACHLRSFIGGINHLKGTCFCCGGADDPDPPELSRREAALAAMEFFERRQIDQQRRRLLDPDREDPE